MFDYLLKNAHMVFEDHIEIKDIALEDGKIAQIDHDIDSQACEIIDCTGLHILPGVIDSQVHFREPGLTHKEDLHTGSLAAVLGGVTTYLEMPNTNPSTTTVDAINDKIRLAKEKSLCHFGFFIGATGNNLDELLKAKELVGCPGIKIFLGSSTGDLLLYEKERLLEIFKNVTLPIAVHSENEEMLKANMMIRDKAKNVHAHYEWRSVETALSSTQRILEIAKEAKRKVHILHITTKDEIDLLAKNKDHCTFEITPQHLTLFAPDCYDELDTLVQMNPPIRTKIHRDGLWRAIDESFIDVLGSDHAPHTLEEKKQGYPKSPSGMPGVQTMLPIMLNHVNNGKMELVHLTNLLTRNPARLYGLKNKGDLKVGYDADITIIDLNKKMILKDEDMGSKVKWTPFRNKEIKGHPVMTFIDGKLVMKNGEVDFSIRGRPVEKS